MRFIKQTSQEGARALTKRLITELQAGQRVLWLLSGGSNIPIQVAIMNQLHGYEANLILLLTDERYGPVGHPDSNWQQLNLAGFKAGVATVIPTLSEGLTLEQTADNFSEDLASNLKHADVVIGQCGMGDDGHIAGILPEAAGLSLDTSSLAIGYAAADFQRLTMTFAVFKQLTAVYAFVYGSSKQLQLQRLHAQSLNITVQPAQILKQLSESYVYNDEIGDTT